MNKFKTKDKKSKKRSLLHNSSYLDQTNLNLEEKIIQSEDNNLKINEGDEEMEEEEQKEEELEEEKEDEENKTINLQEDEIKNEHFQKKNCSLEEHKEIEAISYCQDCNIYICKKCENHHSELFKNHLKYNLDNENIDFFTGFCEEKKHNRIPLEYFCNNHNKLCCASCIAKIKGRGNGKHKDCKVCFIEKIKDKKKKKLNENINYLEELSKGLEQSINDLKKLFEIINLNKEKLKLNIQKIFTKIRNTLNEREDELLFEVDKKFDEIFFNEELIKESEKLPNKVKINLEKGNLINNEWKNKDKLNSIINDCINIENSIKKINSIIKKLEKCNSINLLS